MTLLSLHDDQELRNLIAALRDGRLSAEEATRLNGLLLGSPGAREVFARHALFQATLELAIGHSRPESVEDAASSPSRPKAVMGLVGQTEPEADGDIRRLTWRDRDEFPLSSVSPPVVVVQIDPATPSSSPGLHSFVGSLLFSYAAAIVMMAVAFLVAWSWKTSESRDVARDWSRRSIPISGLDSETPIVGRITGVVDCVWRDPAVRVSPRDGVLLGGKYDLASGFVEISYDTGARVILQGPVTYEVESARGGFLSFGKLTARVERRAEGGGRTAEREVGSGQWAVGSKSEIRNRKSKIPSPPSALRLPPFDQGSKGERTANLALAQNGRLPTTSLAPRPSAVAPEHYPLTTDHYPLFSIRTPTAVVTDLGTEFGVAVDEGGASWRMYFEATSSCDRLRALAMPLLPEVRQVTMMTPRPSS